LETRIVGGFAVIWILVVIALWILFLFPYEHTVFIDSSVEEIAKKKGIPVTPVVDVKANVPAIIEVSTPSEFFEVIEKPERIFVRTEISENVALCPIVKRKYIAVTSMAMIVFCQEYKGSPMEDVKKMSKDAIIFQKDLGEATIVALWVTVAVTGVFICILALSEEMLKRRKNREKSM